MAGRDGAGRGGREHADAAGVVEWARKRLVPGQIDEPVEQSAAGERPRRFAEPLGRGVRARRKCSVIDLPGDVGPSIRGSFDSAKAGEAELS